MFWLVRIFQIRPINAIVTCEVLPLWRSNSCATLSVHRYSSHPFSESKFVSVWDLVMLLGNVDSILVEVYPGLVLPAPCADFVLIRLEWISQGEEGDFEFGAPYLWNFSDLCLLAFLIAKWEITNEVLPLKWQIVCFRWGVTLCGILFQGSSVSVSVSKFYFQDKENGVAE